MAVTEGPGEGLHAAAASGPGPGVIDRNVNTAAADSAAGAALRIIRAICAACVRVRTSRSVIETCVLQDRERAGP